ncbi:hypothetical protein [Paratractidigestivibacter sp.]|uniref:hypothetical protein n=1 Tax=Paratractidigestivibacter sp. TaxID=2847316 RepID=UPI002AC97F73|nr:hypothetical protein [Paratractidigestivibacter sp.]
MKWYGATAYKSEQTGEDELHNPVCSTVEAFGFFVRLGPSHKVRSDTEGNAFDSVSRSLLTKRPSADFDGICNVEVRGCSYEVENVMRDGDTTVVSVKRCKPWA